MAVVCAAACSVTAPGHSAPAGRGQRCLQHFPPCGVGHGFPFCGVFEFVNFIVPGLVPAFL